MARKDVVKRGYGKFCSPECFFKYRDKTPEIRFWAKVKKTSSCWEWQGCKNNKGYGMFRVNNKHKYVHRFSYEIHKGEIPKGKFVCHHCDNPSCVNPDHLFCGTNSDNLMDASRKGRLKNRNHPTGSKNGFSKLNEQKVKKIKKQLMDKTKTYEEISKPYGVDKTTIGLIARNKTWAHVQI